MNISSNGFYTLEPQGPEAKYKLGIVWENGRWEMYHENILFSVFRQKSAFMGTWG